MNKFRFVIPLFAFFLFLSCASNQDKKYIASDSISISEFSSSVELLVSDTNFLEEEILKINAKNPSVQRILVNSDTYLKQGKLIQANSELERALRITKKESAKSEREGYSRSGETAQAARKVRVGVFP